MFKKLFITLLILLFICLFNSSNIADTPPQSCSCQHQHAHLIEIFYKHRKQLKYLEQANHPLIICFSGTPGMGKSTIARRIQEHYKAIVISSDEIRSLLEGSPEIAKNRPSDQPTDKEYFYFLLNHLPQNNRLIVLDMSIDRTYREFLPWAAKHDLPVFIIQIGVPKELAAERIRKRNGKKDGDNLKKLGRCYSDYEKFSERVGVDYELDNTNAPDLDGLYQAINHRLEKQDICKRLFNQIIGSFSS